MEVWLFLEDSCCMTHRKSSERLRHILFMLRGLMTPSMRKWTASFYKITKIVCALWLAERSVCMTVCKHGCGAKLFCFSRANHTSTNLKMFSSSKLDKFTLFTHSFVVQGCSLWKHLGSQMFYTINLKSRFIWFLFYFIHPNTYDYQLHFIGLQRQETLVSPITPFKEDPQSG